MTGPHRGAPVLGRDAGPWGRLVRVAAGGAALTHLLSTKVPERSGAQITAALGTFLALALAYTLVLAVLRPHLTRGATRGLSGWPGGALLLAPLLLYPTGVLPQGPALGVALYTEFSALTAGLIGYGGIELAAIPVMALRFRPVLYGPFNAVDLAERGKAGPHHGSASRIAAPLATLGLAFFWVVGPLAAVKGSFGEAVDGLRGLAPVAGGLLLLAGALWLAPAKGPARMRKLRAGAFLLLGLGGLVGALPDVLWPVVILTGLVLGVLRTLRGRRPPVPAHPASDTPESDVQQPESVRLVAVETTSTTR
ncbi:DUF6410 domain-containing protein [Streptomyces sp. NPDC006879]|uniref:DUF6410 domain-containing protein n=1 Tax=Streptomyces sp. NPDC006879 TaxID=3364767 RepID=UPI0036ACA91F